MRVAVVANEVRGGWDVTKPDGWAGGEETVVGFARALAAARHEVSVIYDGPTAEEVHDGVRYFGRTMLGRQKPSDVAVYFKCPELAAIDLAPRKYLWTDQERPFVPDPLTNVVACSQYLARWLDSMVPRASSRLRVIPYGIDTAEVLAAGEAIVRDPLEVLHCASPDRGLSEFLTLWSRVLAEVPDARLTVAYGWDLFDKYGGSPRLKARILGQLATLPEGAWTMGRLSRLEMHQALHRAGVYAYFCTGGEQFGLTPLKAQLAGCVPVVKPWGALQETVLHDFLVHDEREFVDRLVAVLRSRQGESMAAAREHAESFDWSRIIPQWEALWQAETTLAPLRSEVVTVPVAPAFGNDTGWNMLPSVQPAVAAWMQAVRPARPYIDPSLSFPPGATGDPKEADAAILGWGFEDAENGAAWLRAQGIRTGTPCLLVTSNGAWRGSARRRACSRADLFALFGSMPDWLLEGVPLDGDGNGLFLTAFRWVPERLGSRDPERLRVVQAPRETLSVCLMVRDAAHTLPMMLRSIEPIADEVVAVDTGSHDETVGLLATWSKRKGIPVTLQSGTSPRWCFDCLTEHAVGEMAHGHRIAGFETARNQSIAAARGDWILWLDADEEVHQAMAGAIDKYLRPSMYMGYGISQHHISLNPPEASKVDYPVRLFRRTPDARQAPGWFAHGPLQWPTYHTGLTARFTGIVHEHPGFAPDYTEGVGPVIMLSDAWILHRGYATEAIRRRRFVRNWPLMVADRQKYPQRRLSRFLWIRDLSHQMRYLVEQAGGQVTPDAARLAAEACELFDREFANAADAYCQDALQFASTCATALQRGVEYRVSVHAKKPELTGEETITAEFQGRFSSVEHVLGAIRARLADVSRWDGPYA